MAQLRVNPASTDLFLDEGTREGTKPCTKALLSTIIIELRERTGARAAALERMRFAIYNAYIRARTRIIASGHDVTSTLVAESPTGDARAFCATYFGGERLAPCRAGVVCTVTETTHTTSRKENGGVEKGGGNCPP